jgi:hypothetical protein
MVVTTLSGAEFGGQLMADCYRLIVNMLSGEIPGRPDVDPSHDDLEGVDALLELYHRTRGESRVQVIEALGQIIENAEKHPMVTAQVLSLVNALDLGQLESSIIRLKGKPIAKKNRDLKEEIDNFFAFGQLRDMAHGGALPDIAAYAES